jgi:hypothetical protein
MNKVYTIFYFVLLPTKNSELADIFFEGTIKSLAERFRGGLDETRLFGMFEDDREAEREARALLQYKNHF